MTSHVLKSRDGQISGRDPQDALRLPAERAKALTLKGYSLDEISSFAVPRRTLDRRLHGNERLTLAESDRVTRLERIADHAGRVFGDNVKANRWLRKPNRALEGAVPLELLLSESGARMVEEILLRIEHGIYS